MNTGIKKVTFKSFGLDLAGNMYVPEGFDENKKYKAIVGASPFPQVKEQVLGTYGPEMAKRGFVFLGFDYLGMGDSPALPGEFKQSRYMFRLIENTWDAVFIFGNTSFCGGNSGNGNLPRWLHHFIGSSYRSPNQENSNSFWNDGCGRVSMG